MRTKELKPVEEGQLIPTVDAANKKELRRLASMNSRELKDYHIRLGGNGNNDHIVFFTSDIPPETDGIRLRNYKTFETKRNIKFLFL